MEIKNYRSIWISDVHLGSRGSQAELLVDFLNKHDCDTLYLIGDIIDGWQLVRSGYWNKHHTDVLMAIWQYVERGRKVRYIIGNHDGFLSDFPISSIKTLETSLETFHEAPDGKRYWVIHGDRFDGVTHGVKWLAHFGDFSYQVMMKANQTINQIRRLFGLPYWSLSNWGKQNIKKAIGFITHFEERLITAARQHKCDGVISGHIHQGMMKQFPDGFILINTGDFVESCTVVVEDYSGTIELIRWGTVGDKTGNPVVLTRLG